MVKRKKRRYDAYHALKSHQHVTTLDSGKVHDWEVDELKIGWAEGVLNKKRRSRLGYIEMRKPK